MARRHDAPEGTLAAIRRRNARWARLCHARQVDGSPIAQDRMYLVAYLHEVENNRRRLFRQVEDLRAKLKKARAAIRRLT